MLNIIAKSNLHEITALSPGHCCALLWPGTVGRYGDGPFLGPFLSFLFPPLLQLFVHQPSSNKKIY